MFLDCFCYILVSRHDVLLYYWWLSCPCFSYFVFVPFKSLLKHLGSVATIVRGQKLVRIMLSTFFDLLCFYQDCHHPCPDGETDLVIYKNISISNLGNLKPGKMIQNKAEKNTHFFAKIKIKWFLLNLSHLPEQYQPWGCNKTEIIYNERSHCDVSSLCLSDCLYVANLEFTLTDFSSQLVGDKKINVSVKVKSCYKSLRFMNLFLQIVLTLFLWNQERRISN